MSKKADLEKAKERVRFFQLCASNTEVLSTIQEQYPEGRREIEAIKIAKDALLFVLARRLDEFIEFHSSMSAGISTKEEERLRKLGITFEEEKR
jgi:hypothetical protein